MTNKFTRRTFLRSSAASAAALVSCRYARAFDLNGKLRLAAIGTGNKGADDLREISASPRLEVVAICDVDSSQPHLGWAAEKFPRAARFADYRRLLDTANSFDAVSVSTPDHMHAPIALAAMALGKHVFCQKPLTHTVHEARQMRETAERQRVVTQMGNQIQSHRAYRTAVQLLREGVIGKVREVHSWQAGEMGWLRADKRPATADPVPSTLSWDLWLGVAPTRPFNSGIYHPFSWRAWQDFSNGQLGDFGCHILDPVFMGLGLTAPISIQAQAPPLTGEAWAPQSKVSYQFPATELTTGPTLPLTWYDGRGRQPRPEELGLTADDRLGGAGSAILGEAGTMFIPHWDTPRLFPQQKFRDFKMPQVEDVNHYTGWVEACLDAGKTTSNFNYAAPLTETVLLGSVAIRFLDERLEWDAAKGRITNHDAANGKLAKQYRTDW